MLDIEDTRKALEIMEEALPTLGHGDPALEAAVDVVQGVVDEWVATRPILERVAYGPVYYCEQPEGWFCVHCEEWEDYKWGERMAPNEEERARLALRHADDCIVMLARKMIGGNDAS